MQTVVITEHTLKRNGSTVKCKRCGKEIREGELAVRRVVGRYNCKVVYAHKRCDEERRY